MDKALHASAGLLRSTVTTLHPAVLAQAGLPQALRDLAGLPLLRGRLQMHVQIAGGVELPGRAADLLLYSVAREALTNVVKHTQTHQVWITPKDTATGRRLTAGCGERPRLIAVEKVAVHSGRH